MAHIIYYYVALYHDLDILSFHCTKENKDLKAYVSTFHSFYVWK